MRPLTNRPLLVSLRISLLVFLLSLPGVAQLPLGADHPRPKQAGDPHQHTRVQQVDVEHVHIEIVGDPLQYAIQGRVRIEALALAPGLREVILDGVVLPSYWLYAEVNGEAVAPVAAGGKLLLRLPETLGLGDSLVIEIQYHANPEEGWLRVQQTRPDGDAVVMVHTQGQPEHNHHWFPCFDSPNDLATTELVITAPPGFTALSNGVLVNAAEDGLPAADAEGNRTFHWKQELPHASYLVTLVLGEFDSDHAEAAGVPLGYHVPAGQGDLIGHSFGRTPAMMEHFCGLLGVPYPWPRYDQVVVLGFESGGMENTGQTTLYEATVHGPEDSPDYSADTLIAHELAHQWWGDLVTCENWSHIWLHEGFATYYEALWLEHAEGADAAAWDLQGGAGWYFGTDAGNRRQIVWNGYDDPDQVFDAYAYPKGAWVLHMLRHVTGDEVFFPTLAGFLREHAHRSIDTDDLQAAFDAAHEGGLGWFFDQWLHGGGHPEYRVSQAYDAGAGVLLLTVEQAQKTDDLTGLFRMPVDIEIVGADGSVQAHRIEVSKQKETFVFRCAAEPRDVRFDKGSWILKQLEFHKPTTQLLCQLATDDDVMGRRTAAEALIARLGEGDALLAAAVQAAIGRCLREDSSVELRAHVAAELGQALGGKRWQRWSASWAEGAPAHPAAPATRAWAQEQLLAVLAPERDSRVRTATLYALANFAGDAQVVQAVAGAAQAPDKTYPRAAACRTLGQIGSLDEHGAILEQALLTDTHREVVERAALRALAQLGDDHVYQLAAERAMPACYRDLRGDALTILEALGKANDPQIVSILLPHALDQDRPIRTRAISLLGRYGHLAPELARARLDPVAAQIVYWPQRGQQAKDALVEIERKLKGE